MSSLMKLFLFFSIFHPMFAAEFVEYRLSCTGAPESYQQHAFFKDFVVGIRQEYQGKPYIRFIKNRHSSGGLRYSTTLASTSDDLNRYSKDSILVTETDGTEWSFTTSFSFDSLEQFASSVTKKGFTAQLKGFDIADFGDAQALLDCKLKN